MEDKKVLRIIDANLNRLQEGLRVCEDISRFLLNDTASSCKLKKIRQSIFGVVRNSKISKLQLIKTRDSAKDVGKVSTKKEQQRRNWQAVFLANIARSKESTRVLEEIFKIVNKKAAERFKKIRFAIYEIEKKIIVKHQTLSNSKH